MTGRTKKEKQTVRTLRNAIGFVVVLALIGSAFAQQPPAVGGAGAGQTGGRQGRGGRGNWDPAQFQQMYMQRIKEALAATDEEWQVIEPLVKDVSDKRRELRTGGRMFGGRSRRGGTSGAGNTEAAASNAAPETTALQKALDNKDSSAEALRTALDAHRAAQTKKRAEIEAAQETLKKVLTIRQEAVLVTMGLLD